MNELFAKFSKNAKVTDFRYLLKKILGILREISRPGGSSPAADPLQGRPAKELPPTNILASPPDYQRV